MTLEELREVRRADLLLAFDEHLDVDRRRVSEGAERPEVNRDPGLVVRSAATVDAAAALNRLERRGRPGALVPRRLDVVVRVEEHGRRRRRARHLPEDGRRAAVNLKQLDSLHPDVGEEIACQIGCGAEVA